MENTNLRFRVSLLYLVISVLFAGSFGQSSAGAAARIAKHRNVVLPLGLALTVGTMSLKQIIAASMTEKTTLKTTTNTVKEQIKPSEFAVRVAKRLDGKILKVIKEAGIDADLLTTVLRKGDKNKAVFKKLHEAINIILTSSVNGDQKGSCVLDLGLVEQAKNLLYTEMDPAYHSYLMVPPENIYECFKRLSKQEKKSVLDNFGFVLEGNGDVNPARTAYSKILHDQLTKGDFYTKNDLRAFATKMAEKIHALLPEKPRTINEQPILDLVKKILNNDTGLDAFFTKFRQDLIENKEAVLQKLDINEFLEHLLLNDAFLSDHWKCPDIESRIAVSGYRFLTSSHKKEVIRSLVNVLVRNNDAGQQKLQHEFTLTLRKHLLLDFVTKGKTAYVKHQHNWTYLHLMPDSINRLYCSLPKEKRHDIARLLNDIFNEKNIENKKLIEEYLSILQNHNGELSEKLLTAFCLKKIQAVTQALRDGADPYMLIESPYTSYVHNPLLYHAVEDNDHEIAKVLLSYWPTPIHSMDISHNLKNKEWYFFRQDGFGFLYPERCYSFFNFLNITHHLGIFHYQHEDQKPSADEDLYDTSYYVENSPRGPSYKKAKSDETKQQRNNQKNFKNELLEHFVEKGPLEKLIKNIEMNQDFIEQGNKKQLLKDLTRYSYKPVTDDNGITTCMYDNHILRLIHAHENPSEFANIFLEVLKKNPDHPTSCNHRGLLDKIPLPPQSIISDATSLPESVSAII